MCRVNHWICKSCDLVRVRTDIIYRRVWRWRTRYGTHPSGLGTGIGEGNEGVKCGRDSHCLAAGEVEVEVDWEAEVLAGNVDDPAGTSELDREDNMPLEYVLSEDGKANDQNYHGQADKYAPTIKNIGHDSSTTELNSAESRNSQTGYFRQEIQGIGGVVKKKLKTRVRVGAVVDEYEDERDSDSHLVREQKGLNRSWCGWCDRVIPGAAEQVWPSKS